MSVLESMKRGAKMVADDPGGALKRIRRNAAGQTAKAGAAAEKAAKSAGMAMTRGAGTKPAKNLYNVLKKVFE